MEAAALPKAERPKVADSAALVPVWAGDEIASYALVGAAVYPAVAAHRWEMVEGYATTTELPGRPGLHRFVLGLQPGDGLIAHHRNNQRLDCRRANLRALTRDEHLAAHNQLPRLDSPARPLHPAIDRGIRHWLDGYRGDPEQMMPTPPPPPRPRSLRKLPKTLTADEVEVLMSMPNLRAPTGLRDRCILGVMHRCGLRVSEVCGLHLRDVKWKEGQIHVRPEVGKGGKEAVVYLDPQTQELLERWVVVRRGIAAGKPHLFTTLTGGPVSRRSIWKMTARRARKGGIERPVHPHMLRHTYATELLREGFNLREVQQLLRHSDIRTTVVYTHLFEADLSRKIRDRA